MNPGNDYGVLRGAAILCVFVVTVLLGALSVWLAGRRR